MNIWYYLEGDQKKGPVSRKELRQMVISGQLPHDVNVWREGMIGWKPLNKVDLYDSGESFESGVSDYSRTRQSLVVAPFGYAGFWRRFFAYLIDMVIIIFIQGLIYGFEFFLTSATAGTITGITYMGLSLISWLYWAFFESSTFQATPGKMALEIKVCDEDGRRISFLRATGRYFAKILSALILYIGFLMIAFTSRKQGLHDMLAGCLVIKNPDKKAE